jgi:elongation factor 1-alpha
MSIFFPEKYYGNIEYKVVFNTKNILKIQKYTTQMNFRINEGNGEAIYVIGINDNGKVIGLTDKQINDTILTLRYMTNKINSKIKFIMNCNFKQSRFLIIKIFKDDFEEQLLF